MTRFDTQMAVTGGDSTRVRGHLKWFNAAKGFGFVTIPESEQDAFLHISVLHRFGRADFKENAEIDCEITQGPRGPQVMRVIEVVEDPNAPPASSGRPLRPER
ncbi:MAG: cold shock domain-containing protein, partial [Pseudomonadota bacterium]|nr:cold shock domain-containing protein [Pseudomonadota bacterium]